MKKFFLDKPLHQIIFTLFVILVSLLLFILIGFGIAALFGGEISKNLFSGQYDFISKQGIASLKYLQAIQAIGIFIAAPLFLAFFMSASPMKFLGFNKVNQGRVFFIAAATLLAGIPVFNAMGALNMQLSFPSFMKGIENWMRSSENTANQLTIAFLEANNISGYMVNFIIIALIPAFGEEMLFRGIFQKLFIEWTKNIHTGIIITAFIFSAMHMQFFTFLPRFAIGILLGYLFVWTGSIWVPILVHFVNNAMAVSIASFTNNAFNQSFYDTVGTDAETWGYVLVSVMGVSVLLFLLLQVCKMEPEKST